MKNNSGVNVVLVMAYGSLVFLLLFFFVKRQVMRLAMKSKRGPHAPIGHKGPKQRLSPAIGSRQKVVKLGHRDGSAAVADVIDTLNDLLNPDMEISSHTQQERVGQASTVTKAVEKLKQEIEAKLNEVQKIHFEPRLLSPDDDRLNRPASYDYLFRMKALDAIRDTDFPFRELGGASTAVTGEKFRRWLLNIRNSHCMFRDRHSGLVDTVLDGYTKARHGAEAFGEEEFLKYQDALVELASIVKSGGSSTASQHHQSAAADLSGPSEPVGASVSPDQTAYLTSSVQQRSKKPRHFLELKNFKDNYNTLDNIA